MKRENANADTLYDTEHQSRNKKEPNVDASDNSVSNDDKNNTSNKVEDDDQENTMTKPEEPTSEDRAHTSPEGNASQNTIDDNNRQQTPDENELKEQTPKIPIDDTNDHQSVDTSPEDNNDNQEDDVSHGRAPENGAQTPSEHSEQIVDDAEEHDPPSTVNVKEDEVPNTPLEKQDDQEEVQVDYEKEGYNVNKSDGNKSNDEQQQPTGDDENTDGEDKVSMKAESPTSVLDK